jgi:hypothetical protein
MNALNLKLYAILKNDGHLSEVKAQEFIQTLDELIQQDIKSATNEYHSVIKEDMLRLEMTLGKEMKEIEMGLLNEIKDAKVDTFRWMVGIFITLALMILGLYIKK